MVHNGHTFYLNVKQLYRKIEGQEKYQIRKPHRLHVHNLKALMRLNPYAHVVDYVVLLEMEDIPVRNEFDESRCCDYNYYVFGGNHSTKVRRELMQEFPTNPIF